MSAAIQFPRAPSKLSSLQLLPPDRAPGAKAQGAALVAPEPPRPGKPSASLAFYRRHTQKLLRRYLYASMLLNRAPAVLAEPLMRGWASHQRAETFEDCVIFVLDVEKGLAQLSPLERALINRVALQEYSYAETALLLHRSERMICKCFLESLDRLTHILLQQGTLILPHQRPGEACPDADE